MSTQSDSESASERLVKRLSDEFGVRSFMRYLTNGKYAADLKASWGEALTNIANDDPVIVVGVDLPPGDPKASLLPTCVDDRDGKAIAVRYLTGTPFI